MLRPERKFILRDFTEKKNDKIGESLEDFIILKVFNEKQYGFVAKVKSKLNDKIYVMKKTDMEEIGQRPLKVFRNEYNIIKQLDHENICKYCASFKKKEAFYIITEYYDNGNLLDLIRLFKKKTEIMKEELLLKIFLQCLKGLNYIHSKQMIHRNIKLTNIIVDNNWHVSLIDFKMAVLSNPELAKDFTDDDVERNDLKKDSTFVNVDEHEKDFIDYIAPEIKNKNNYDNKIDIYSLGKTFCYLAYLSKDLPKNDKKSPDLYKLIEKMVSKNPEDRPSASELYDEFEKLYVKQYFYNKSGIDSTIRCLYAFPNLSNVYNSKINNSCETLNNLNKCFEKLKALESNKDKKDEEKNEKLLNLNISLNKLREAFYKNTVKNLSYNNKEIEPISLINYMISEIIEEHNKLNRPFIINNPKLLEEMHTLMIDKLKSYESYVNFYNHYFHTFISDNFFGTIKTKRICKKCKFSEYIYNFYHMIPFNVKYLTEAYPNNNKLNIYDAFDCLNTKIIETNEKYILTCFGCKRSKEMQEYKNFYNTPKNLIIYFDRGQKCQYTKFINFSKELKLNRKQVESLKEFKDGVKYILYGIICRIEEFDQIKKKRKAKYISFTYLENEGKYLNNDTGEKCDLIDIKNTGDVVNLFYFCDQVKGINITKSNNCIVQSNNLNVNSNNKSGNEFGQKNNFSNNNNINVQNNNVINNNNINKIKYNDSLGLDLPTTKSVKLDPFNSINNNNPVYKSIGNKFINNNNNCDNMNNNINMSNNSYKNNFNQNKNNNFVNNNQMINNCMFGNNNLNNEINNIAIMNNMNNMNIMNNMNNINIMNNGNPMNFN